MTLTSENNSDVLIVGGGIIGLALARAIHRRGVARITILERGALGQEASHAAAGMLAPHAETDRPDEFFRFCEESNRSYPHFAEALLEETGVDVELDRHGTLYLAFNEDDVEEIRRRFEWQTRAGLRVERLTARETHQAEPFVSPDALESLFFPNDWQVENRQVVRALRKYAELNGIKVRENTEITHLLTERGEIVGAGTAAEKFYAGKTVVATGAWTSLIQAEGLQMPPVRPIRGQMIAFHTAKRLFEKVIYSPRGYLVPRADGRVLIGATVEDVGFNRETTTAGLDFLRDNAIELAPSLIELEIAEKWAGLRPFAADGRPVLGSFAQAENLFLATAHYRNGILLAPLTAKIMAEKIVGNQDSDYLRIFSPERLAPVDLRVSDFSA
jgi:glycine oxidase